MATCSNCSADVRDGAWVCGLCGAAMPRQSAPAGASGYADGALATSPSVDAYTATLAMAPSAPAAAPATSGTSSAVKIAIAVGVVAVLAIVVVWFLFLQTGDASKFVGTWVPSAGSSGTSASSSIGRIVIAKSGSGATITLFDEKGQPTGPFKAKMNGSKLETGLEYAGNDSTEKMKADLMKAVFGAFIKDFKLVFTAQSQSTLLVEFGGKMPKGLSQMASQPGILTRAQ